jgi:hypothetical protein
MLRLLLVAIVVNCAAVATAGKPDAVASRGVGGFGGFQFGEHGGFGEFRGLGLGFGFGFVDPERTQERFEMRFDDLMTDYEQGVEEITDFYESDEYEDIVNDTERLAGRYDLFLSGVEHKTELVGGLIDVANDSLVFFDDLLADYQADEDLSPERLERLEVWIGRVTDRIDMKIDRLTEVQTTLEDNLPTYQTFQTDVDTFLTEIVAAGEGTTGATATSLTFAGTADSSFEGAASNFVNASVFAEAAFGNDMGSSGESSAVPEPAAAFSMVVIAGQMALRRRRSRI